MFSSLRIRLTFYYAGALALFLLLFALVFYILIDRTIRQIADDSIEDAVNSLIATLRTEKRLNAELRLTDETINEALEDFRFQNMVFAVYDDDLRTISLSPRLRPSEERRLLPFNLTSEEIPAETIRTAAAGGEGFGTMTLRDEPEIRVFVKRAEFENRTLMVAAIRPLSTQMILLGNIRLFIAAGIPFALVLASVGGYFLARKSLKPVREMSEKAAEITSQNLAERLPSGVDKDELGDLAAAFNSMLARLEGSFELQKRFMADASHELRTPLAIIRGESEVSLQMERRGEDEYRESLDVIRQEGIRLSHIVEDLFILARADAGQFRPGRTTFYLDELAAECGRAIRTLLEEKNLGLDLDIEEGLVFGGDEALVRRLIMNLLDNAVKYSDPGGSVGFSCRRSGGEYEITVSNAGKPIPEDQRKQIFERFFRADKARSHNTDYEFGTGAGLGLAIGASIARVHGGFLELVRSDDSSTVFRVRLPRGSG